MSNIKTKREFIPTKNIPGILRTGNWFGDINSGAIKMIILNAAEGTDIENIEFCSDGIIITTPLNEIDFEESLEEVNPEIGEDLEIKRFLEMSIAERMNSMHSLGYRMGTLVLDATTNQRKKLSGEPILGKPDLVLVSEDTQSLEMAAVGGGSAVVYAKGRWAMIK